MTNPDNSLHALDDIFVTDHRGQPVVCIGLSQTFYLADCTSLETRLRIGRCAEDYLQRYGERSGKPRSSAANGASRPSRVWRISSPTAAHRKNT